jgi:glyoxylase-like metal-dependent hydrolase (beta-lactamase superfamily II)
VKRVIMTHYHPDHAGNAEWLCARFGVELWTTQGEYLTAHAVRASAAGYTTEAVLKVFQRNGLDTTRHAAMSGRGNRYGELVPDFPHSYRRIIEGDRVRIGGHEWRAIIGHGHAPEHLSLYCEALNVLIAGDMLLSTISTNVSVWSIDPEGDPLRLFLESIARYRELPADTLVLPSHGKPFRGAHERVAQLEQHHQERFAELKLELKKGERSAGELLPVLFRRPLDAHQTFFAMGEAIAHLHYLYYAGEAKRAAGADGIMRYAAR